MKFMTWNVNGIRALTQYHPYCDDLHKNYREILDYLGADIICLQETKITRSKLESDLALVPGYNSYWSFHRTKSGYSGVAIYVKDHIKLLAAEEGISGILSGNLSPPTPTLPGSTPGSQLDSVLDERFPKVGGYPTMETQDPAVYIRLQELDSEGRGIILDFGFFVLFNLYCPNETDETRLPFKMDYYNLLEARVRELIKEGRQVMVLGDMNVIPSELDHCDPAKWKKESGETDFTNTPPRRWFNGFLAPNGPLTDLYRVFHKDEPGAFTCWNTKINARPSNYGTRLDFILVTEGLLPWFKSCNRLPHVVGSDHCPVIAEMFPELKIVDPSGETQEEKALLGQCLQNILDSYGGSTDQALAAKFYDEFSGKQQKLSSFFKKSTKESASCVIKGAALKRKLPISEMGDEEPRTKPFFSADKIFDTPASSIFVTSSQITGSNNTPPPAASSSASNSVLSKPTAKMLPKAATARVVQGKAGGKKTASKPAGQQSVLSFFSTPGTNKQAAPEPSTSSPITNSQLSSSQSVLSQSSDVSSQPQSTQISDEGASFTSSSLFSPNDFADWIPGSQDVMPFMSNEESTTSKWQSLFTPKVVPKCKFHQETCTEYTVNKKGPNKGRRFFLCSRPVGPEGDSIGQNPEYRCNHFQWLNPPGNGTKKIN